MHFRAEVFSAILAILNHFFTLLAGCVATVLLALYEKFGRKEPIPRKVYAWIIIGFVFWACIGAIRDEQRNTRTVVADKAKLTSDFGICTADLRFAREKADFYQEQVNKQQQTINGQQTTMTAQQQTLNTAQQAQNAQQGTMNSCVVALGKANTPEPPKISTGFIHAEFVGLPPTKHRDLLFAFTNKPIPSPLKVRVECTKPVAYIDLALAGQSLFSDEGSVRGYVREWQIMSPQWTPTNPLTFAVGYDRDDDSSNCSVLLK